MDIDNLNSSVINWSMVHGTWCTKSLRASDVIGIYWSENWDALSPLELRVPSGSSFIPSFQPFSPNKPSVSPLSQSSTLHHSSCTKPCYPFVEAIHLPFLLSFLPYTYIFIYILLYVHDRTRIFIFIVSNNNNSFNSSFLEGTFFTYTTPFLSQIKN